MKHSKIIFALIIILGIIFLIMIPIGSYLYARDSINILASLDSSTQFGLFFFLSGTGMVTSGIIGLNWKNERKHKKRFVALHVLIIPLTTFIIVLIATIFPNIGFISILSSEITQVTVIDTNPLALSVDVKAITSRDSYINGATIWNDNMTLVAKETDLSPSASILLPTGSEISLTLNFKINLTSGNYTVSLATWHGHHGRSSFIIP